MRDPLRDTGGGGGGCLRRGRMIGDDKLVADLLRRGEVEMASTTDDAPLALMDEGDFWLLLLQKQFFYWRG